MSNPVPAQVGAPVGLRYNRGAVPTIKRFMASDAFIRGLMGPVGGGKSSGCLWDLVQRGVRQAPGPDGVRRSRWVVVRNTYGMLKDTTIATVHQWFPPRMYGKWLATDHRYIINSMMAPGDDRPAEIELLFRALDHPDHVRNLLSLEVTGGWVNEAREIPWSIIEVLQSRVGRYPAMRDGGATWSGLIMDTNPPDIDSEWFKFFEQTDHSEAVEALVAAAPSLAPAIKQHGFSAIFKQPSGTSPEAENGPNLLPGYYQRISVGKSPDWIKVYVRGEYGFVIDGQPVFPEYEDSFHCAPFANQTTIRGLPIYRGWDWGLTPACVFTQMLPSGQWFIADELVATGMGADRFTDEVIAHSNQFFPGCEFVDYGDPAGEQRAQTDERTCFEICHSKGIAIEAAEQAPMIRTESVRKPLRTIVGKAKPGFALHPRCSVLRRAMAGGYQYRKMKTGGGDRFTEKPDKNRFSHVADALCYVASRLFGPALRFQGAEEDAEVARFNSRLAQDRTRSLTTGY
jgi:hypothetical protein